MEINPNDKLLAPVYPEETANTKKISDAKFGAIFKEFINNSSKIDEDGKKTPTIEIISAIQLNPFLSVREMSLVERAERMLDALDEYQQKLASPKFTLRDISPLISEMEAENEILVSAADSLSDGDELKNILNQVIITSSVEIIKFNRGDYVNP